MSVEPLYVRVAEALGWTRCSRSLAAGLSPERFWSGRPPKGSDFRFPEDDEPYYEYMIPRYDTDWAATGPLIERLGVTLNRHRRRADWSAHAGEGPETDGPTALVAACNLILALAGAGKLPR
jgi:hypothetical protein